MTAIPIEELLSPLSQGQPCGPDLEYDPEFMALEIASRGKPERQAGDKILPPEPPDWTSVYDSTLLLAGRTRDIRIAVLLARAASHTRGIRGYADGVTLLAGLLERFWDCVHPALDQADGGDATMRLNALAPLSDKYEGLADLRACAIGSPGDMLTARLVELAWARAEPLQGELKPTQAGVLEGLRSTTVRDPAVLDALRASCAAVKSIEKCIAAQAGIGGPDLKPLVRITDALHQATMMLDGVATADTNGGEQKHGDRADGGAGRLGTIQSRDDVLRALDMTCDWIERHEPANPAPLLIRRAQRLMSKTFIDLVRDLAPEGLRQVEVIAGVAES